MKTIPLTLLATALSPSVGAVQGRVPLSGKPFTADLSVPLYLWSSHSDTALLPRDPAEYLSGTANYSLVFPEPVAFAYALDGEPTYPLVTLRAFWSEERGDVQTTTWSLQELNAHGGNYVPMADLGLLAKNLTALDAAGFVPLFVSYDDGRSDAATGPFSAPDLDLLLPAPASRAQPRTCAGPR